MREERSIAKILRFENQLARMFNARVFKPSEKDIQDAIKVCTEVREVLLCKNTDNKELDYLKGFPLESISSCYYFINKAIDTLIKNKSKCPWYMHPVAAETMTFGEILILTLIIYGSIGLFLIMK